MHPCSHATAHHCACRRAFRDALGTLFREQLEPWLHAGFFESLQFQRGLHTFLAAFDADTFAELFSKFFSPRLEPLGGSGPLDGVHDFAAKVSVSDTFHQSGRHAVFHRQAQIASLGVDRARLHAHARDRRAHTDARLRRGNLRRFFGSEFFGHVHAHLAGERHLRLPLGDFFCHAFAHELLRFRFQSLGDRRGDCPLTDHTTHAAGHSRDRQVRNLRTYDPCRVVHEVPRGPHIKNAHYLTCEFRSRRSLHRLLRSGEAILLDIIQPRRLAEGPHQPESKALGLEQPAVKPAPEFFP